MVRQPLLRLMTLLAFAAFGCGDDAAPADADGGLSQDARVSNDAASNDAASNDAASNDAASNDAGLVDQRTSDDAEVGPLEDLGVDAGAIMDASRPDRGVPPGPNEIRNYIFGHSLINHAIPTTAVTPNETAVPHWLGAFARADARSYTADGQYGFLLQHANLPPSPQWGFESVSGAWPEGSAFSEADFTTVLLTPANFIQYQPSTSAYEGDNPRGASPVSATTEIFRWVREQEPGIDVYIYENWPDMDAIAGYPPSEEGWNRYNAEVLGAWHDWWLTYHDAVRAELPDANVHMIPVGPILAEVLTTSPWSGIPVVELYEDGAPHGLPTIYFLAAMVCYHAMYRRDVPEDITVPLSVHSRVRDALPQLNALIRTYLDDFVDGRGEHRVW